MPYARAAAGKNIKTVTVSWSKLRKHNPVCGRRGSQITFMRCLFCFASMWQLLISLSLAYSYREESIDERVNILSF